MPELTGIELCNLIRREAKDSYTYIILLTSLTDKEQVIDGLGAGADDYLTKPFHRGELLARVGVGLRNVELHQQLQATNLLLKELALTDALTGLPNRRAIEHWGVRQLSGAVRHGFEFWVVAADLDNFKSVNDRFGHEAGDTVLKRFAEILKANTRGSNICGRIGGEEFLIILTHAGRSDANAVIDRIREKFQNERFTFGERVLNVTASFGISGLQANVASTLTRLIAQADAGLYAAKHGGRNRVAFAASEHSPLATPHRRIGAQ